MKKDFHSNTNDHTDHSAFGGIVCPSDFNTSYPSGTIAERIAKDAAFDQQCQKRHQYLKQIKKGGNQNERIWY